MVSLRERLTGERSWGGGEGSRGERQPTVFLQDCIEEAFSL